MKVRLLILFVLCLSCAAMQAQKSEIILDLGYRTPFDNTNLGIGIQYKYNLPYSLRLAADIIAYMPADNDFGLDANVNMQYKININEGLICYPFLGAIMSNHSFSAVPEDRLQTEYGLNLGLGVECRVNNRSFINVDFRFNFISKEKPAWYKDYSLIRIGYGFKL